MGMVLVAGPAGGAVPRRLPDSPPIAGPQAGRSVGGVRWRDWDSYQRGEELHSTSQPPPPLLPNSQQRLARATSQDPAENAFWQRNVVIIPTLYVYIALERQRREAGWYCRPNTVDRIYRCSHI